MGGRQRLSTEMQFVADRQLSGDSSYSVESHNWPLTSSRTLASGQVVRVLRSFARFHPLAVASLASGQPEAAGR